MEILMIYSETPDDRIEVISLFEDSNAVLEEFFVSQFPKNEPNVKSILIKNVLRFEVSIDLFVTIRT